MNKKRIYIAMLALCAVIILLSIICVRQYCIIQKAKVLDLNNAFYYMQEIIKDESKNNYENWGNKASRLYVLQDDASNDEKNMGDYDEVKTLIFNISQIENPKHIKAQKLLNKANDMKIAWCTEIGKWSVEIIK